MARQSCRLVAGTPAIARRSHCELSNFLHIMLDSLVTVTIIKSCHGMLNFIE